MTVLAEALAFIASMAAMLALTYLGYTAMAIVVLALAIIQGIALIRNR